jgi:alkylated DNA repair dioxygenase AlkB
MADSQLALFSEASGGPQGLRYWPEFIASEDERALIARIRELPLAPFQFGAYEGKRRVAFFGSRYDFTHQRLEGAAEPPGWILPFAERIERSAGLAVGRLRHVLFTEYDVGAGIGWHRDRKHFDRVFGLSLGSACRFRFRRNSGTAWKRFTLDAAPRSLYELSGEARHVWEHSIPLVASPRYSVTFRTLA